MEDEIRETIAEISMGLEIEKLQSHSFSPEEQGAWNEACRFLTPVELDVISGRLAGQTFREICETRGTRSVAGTYARYKSACLKLKSILFPI